MLQERFAEAGPQRIGHQGASTLTHPVDERGQRIRGAARLAMS